MSDNRYRDVPPKTNRKGESDDNARDGGDNLLINSSPTDSRSDEKVVVNEQRGNKIVNGPSQTAPNTSEGNSFDEEIIE